MPTANSNVFALFPLQEVIFDKDGTGPLASGAVSFFSDPGFSVPKSVYEETLNPDNTITYTNLGNVLVLSGIGSFVDGIGNNFIPLLYPFVGSPADTTVGASQPYYITVYSSAGVFQFSVNDWPPNSFGSTSSSTFQDALTQNLLSNPNFSVISFTPDPATGSYVYNVTGNMTTDIAPGWSLVTAGTGVITVTQVSLNQSITGESPYSLELSWTSSSTLTTLQIVQKLTNSPRIIADQYASASLEAASMVSAVGIQLIYMTPDGVNVIIASGNAGTPNVYTRIFGTTPNPLPATSTQGASGYVNFIINVLSPTVNSNILINNAQMVEVANAAVIAPDFIQQTTQQQLNGLMWYYEPQLAFKPIPSYAIGWDFKFNPCQEFGYAPVSGGGYQPTAVAQYMIDQTILFQSTINSISYAVVQNAASAPFSGLNISTANAASYALIQYLDTPTALELLSQKMSVRVKGYVTDGTIPNQTLIGTVNLYFSTNSSPTVPALPTVFFSTLGGSGAALVPTTIASGWTLVPRSGFTNTTGVAASFQFTTASQEFMFNGWDARTLTNIRQATAFAIVVSFNAQATTTVNTLNYITLCAGDFATVPAPLNAAQTLQALQYYYETSYSSGIPIGSTSGNGGEGGTPMFPQQTYATGSTYASNFSIRYNSEKRVTNSTITLYNPITGNAASVSGQQYNNGNAQTVSPVNVSGNWTQTNPGTRGVEYDAANGTSSAAILTSGANANVSGIIRVQYAIDARLGIV